MRRYRYARMVHWSECDPAGIIFFPHYARWMAEGLVMFLLDLGIDPVGLTPAGTSRGIPAVGYSTNFHAPAVLHETVIHEIAVSRIGRSSIAFAHRFLRGDELLADAAEVRIWAELTAHGISPEPVPTEVRAELELDGDVSSTHAVP